MKQLIGLFLTIWLGLSFGGSMVIAGESSNDVTSVASVSTNAVVNNWEYEEQAPIALPVSYYDDFEHDIFELYLEQCDNYCSDCDYYYYKECNCNVCYSDCADCSDYDFELFIDDNYDMILEYYDFLLEVAQEQFFKNQMEGRQLSLEQL
jgi:hypothetical protein